MKSTKQQRKLYLRLIECITADLIYPRALSECVDAAEREQLGKALVSMTFRTGRTLLLIKELVFSEFEQNCEAPSTILRLNSVASKVMGDYTRRIGTDFLRGTLGDLVHQVCNMQEALEVNPQRLGSSASAASDGSVGTDEPDDPELAKNRQALDELAQRFFDTMSSDDRICRMPREIRCAAWIVKEECRKRHLEEHASALVGGYVMLRFLNAAVATPESFGLLDDGQVPSITSRRTLVLVSKILQNLSNGVEFGKKEKFMEPFNEFLDRNKQGMQNFLARVAEDPNQADFSDILADGAVAPETMAEIETALQTDETLLQHCGRVHKLLYLYSRKVVVASQEAAVARGASGNEMLDRSTDLLELLGALGPPPQSKYGQELEDLQAALEECQESAFKASLNHIVGLNIADFDTSELQKAQFLYGGDEASVGLDGRPVIYFVLSRLKPEFLDDERRLIVHIMSTCGHVLDNPYSLVIDMSWSSTAVKEFKKRVVRSTALLSRVFSRSHRKSLASCYIVHPTPFVETLLWYLKAFASAKVGRKIIKINRWKDILQFIDAAHVQLPESTKSYIGKLYNVDFCAQGARPALRHIKLALDSIVIVERRNKAYHAKAEILHGEIDDIAKIQPASIVLSHRGNSRNVSEAEQRVLFACDKVPVCFELEFQHGDERDEFLAELLALAGDALASSHAATSASFLVTKQTRFGRSDRIIKVASDSIVVATPNGHIKREITFAGVQTIVQGTGSVVVTMRGSGKARTFDTPQCAELAKAINDAFAGFRDDENDSAASAQRHSVQLSRPMP